MNYIAHVTNLAGRRVMLFARFPVELPQHEYECTDLILAARPDAVRRGHQVGQFRPDAVMLFGDVAVYLERERTRKSLDRVRERIREYGDCPNDVCWVVDTVARLNNIIDACDPPPNHLFTTFRQAVEHWSDANIWRHNNRLTR